MSDFLEIEDLHVRFRGPEGVREAVRGVSLAIGQGEMAALVGESGSGKTLTARSIVRLLPPDAEIPQGAVRLDGENLLAATEERMRSLRGRVLGMVFQDPLAGLNPLHRAGRQIDEVLRVHSGLSADGRRARVAELLEMVSLPAGERIIRAFPHELSGGQRQRVMLAMALACSPRLLVADEPTTALDALVQTGILRLIDELRRRLGMAVLLVTHDLGIARRFAGRVHVMQDGRVVESGSAAKLFAAPAHPCTRRLLEVPDCRTVPLRGPRERLLELDKLTVSFARGRGLFGRPRGAFRAVDRVSLALDRGECLGVAGESGSGKSTLALAVLGLISSEGGLRFLGRDPRALKPEALRALRRYMQVVFQDPFSSLSPRMTLADIVTEGVEAHAGRRLGRTEKADIAAAALAEVELDPAWGGRYPHELSGGQRQRAAIARALAVQPDLLVLDEPTSSLDRSLQFQILRLLAGRLAARGMACLFITHDLRLARGFCHRVLILQNGRCVEQGETEALLAGPRTPYARALVRAGLDGESF